jgi:hypothetical protein
VIAGCGQRGVTDGVILEGNVMRFAVDFDHQLSLNADEVDEI